MEQPKPPPADEIEDDLDRPDIDPERPQSDEAGEPAEGRRLTDMLRKAMVAGLGAVFMTEEGIRTYVKDLKLPKDVVGFVVGQAERSKSELFRVIGEELHRFFESELLRREVVRLLSEVTIEISAQIRLKPDGSGKPEVKVNSTTARRVKRRK
jgi:hypothetical protein